MSYQSGFGGRVVPDAADPRIDHLPMVACGTCHRTVPTGNAHIIIDGRGYHGGHIMYCPECCPGPHGDAA